MTAMRQNKGLNRNNVVQKYIVIPRVLNFCYLVRKKTAVEMWQAKQQTQTSWCHLARHRALCCGHQRLFCHLILWSEQISSIDILFALRISVADKRHGFICFCDPQSSGDSL